MNPSLIMFAVELQNGEKIQQKETKKVEFRTNVGKRFFNFLKLAKVTVPVSKND